MSQLDPKSSRDSRDPSGMEGIQEHGLKGPSPKNSEAHAAFVPRTPDPDLSSEFFTERPDLTIARESQSPEGRSMVNSGGSKTALTRMTEVAKAVIQSNNSYASIGNCLLTSSLWTGLLFHPLCSILAVRNEMAEDRRKSGLASVKGEYSPGIRQEVLDLCRSPGVYRFSLGTVFILNLVESVARGQVLYSLAFGTAALANLGASSMLNNDYYKALDSSRGVVRRREERPSIQLLTSPGINWSVCDVLFGFFTLPSVPVLSSAGISASVAGGAAAAALLSPVWLGARVAKSSIPLFLNVVTNFGFGAAQVASGSLTLGIVCFSWGISSGIMAMRQSKASQAS